jgi:hypothetical protein
MTTFKEYLEESKKFNPGSDYKEGSIIVFNNGEEFIVVKRTKVSTHDYPADSKNELRAVPYNKLAKDKNTSISTSMDTQSDWFKKNVKEIIEKK